MDPSLAAAIHVSPDDANLDPYEQEEITFGDFEVGEATRLFSGAMLAFCTAPVVMTRSNTPFAAVHMRLGLQPIGIGSH